MKAVWLGLVGILALAAPVAAQMRPDIVVVVVDDLGYADLPHLPTLQARARSGTRFLAHYAAPWCSPSRAALFTGRHPDTLGIGLRGKGEKPELPRDVPTLGAVFAAAGYETAYVGKWHLGTRSYNRPLTRGWEHFTGCLGGGIDYWTHRTLAGKLDWWHGDTLTKEPGHVTALLGDAAVERIERRDPGRPLLLLLSFTAPHLPLQPADRRRGTKREKYLALLQELDFQLNRVLDRLPQAVLWVQSDNGGHLPEADNAPWRGGKHTAWEGGLRVPAFLCGPGIAPGEQDGPTHTIDVLPTLCALAGIVPPPTEGVDLLANGAPHPDGLLLSRSYYGTAYRKGPWKALRLRKGPWRLYDVVQDPGEARDVSREYPEVLTDLLTRALPTHLPAPRGCCRPPSPSSTPPAGH